MSVDSINAIFKAYDVRGLYPSQLDEAAAKRISQGYAAVRQPKKIAVGRDVRGSGEELKKALVESLLACGVDVVDIGIITTDQLYFAVGNYDLDGGISVTASHNPGEYNGFKFAEAGGAPIASEDLSAIRDWAASNKKLIDKDRGRLTKMIIIDDYINHVLSYIDISSIKPYEIVANANFGAVGQVVDRIAPKLKMNLERLNWQEDGTFPKGPPNPLLPENRRETAMLIKKVKADLGVAWDADADRVFFFTHEGVFIPSCFILALLAREFLNRFPGSKIIHDVTTAWVIDDTVKEAGGEPITNRTGHTFIKARMRLEDAPFAGESSGHYYFRDSFYADNGIVPLLVLLQLMSETGKSLKDLVLPMMTKYKVSGEINFTVADPLKTIRVVEVEFADQGKIDKTDGLSIINENWRFNIRPSNTEPLFRLNAEAHDQKNLDGLVTKISSLLST